MKTKEIEKLLKNLNKQIKALVKNGVSDDVIDSSFSDGFFRFSAMFGTIIVDAYPEDDNLFESYKIEELNGREITEETCKLLYEKALSIVEEVNAHLEKDPNYLENYVVEHYEEIYGPVEENEWM